MFTVGVAVLGYFQAGRLDFPNNDFGESGLFFKEKHGYGCLLSTYERTFGQVGQRNRIDTGAVVYCVYANL